jgi:hypothetical protein
MNIHEVECFYLFLWINEPTAGYPNFLIIIFTNTSIKHYKNFNCHEAKTQRKKNNKNCKEQN